MEYADYVFFFFLFDVKRYDGTSKQDNLEMTTEEEKNINLMIQYTDKYMRRWRALK